MKKTIIILMFLVLLTTTSCNKEIKEDVVKVTFDSQGGTRIQEQVLVRGECIKEPSHPEKEGFIFVEWQLNNHSFDFSTEIVSDIMLVAKYKKCEGIEVVTVSFDYQNGQDVSVVEIVKGGKITEHPIPSKEGYSFVAWFHDNSKFDFSSNIDDNITLVAEWKKNEVLVETERPSQSNNEKYTENNDIEDPNVEIENSSESVSSEKDYEEIEEITENLPDYETMMLPYEGQWYLDGYKDVYISFINIYESGGLVSLGLEAFNYALPIDKSTPVKPYTIYPYDNFVDNPEEDYWSNGFHMVCDTAEWQNELVKYNLKLGENCVYLGGKKFVREQGAITMYDDTCYRDAIGSWFMENNSDSTLDIWKKQDLGALGDYISVSMFNFNINTLDSEGSSSVELYAARKNNWEKYGISVKNDVLTISNSNGTKKFYRNGIKLAVEENITLAIGESKEMHAIVLPQASTNQSVSWKSSDTSVVTISGNIIKAVGTGTAIVTGKSVVGGHIVTSEITVYEAPLIATANLERHPDFPDFIYASVSASGGSCDYTTYKLKLYFNGELLTEKDDDSILRICKEEGEYRLEVYVKDSNGNEAIDVVTVVL